MKKNFLLLLLLTLLPFAGWAQTANNWTYDGGAHNLVTWTGGSGTKYYAVTTNTTRPGTSSFSTTVPQRTDAGTYYVWCATHTGMGGLTNAERNAAAMVTVTVSKATPTVTAPTAATGLAWNNSAQTLASGASVTPNTLTVEYSVDGGAWTTSEPTATKAGDYEIRYRVQGNTNYNNVDPTSLGTVTIAKAEVTVHGYGINKVWDESFADPTIADFDADENLRQVENHVGSLTWDLVHGYLEFARVDNGTDVGIYTYTFGKTAAYDAVKDDLIIHMANSEAKLNITQATNVAGTVTLSGWTYGETANTPVAAGFKYGNDLAEFTYSTDGGSTFTTDVPTDAGTGYIVRATVPETINYTEVYAETTFDIAKADLTPVAANVAEDIVEGLVYTGSPLKLLKGEFPLPEFNGTGYSGTFTYYIDGTPVTGTWEDVVGTDADEDVDAYEITYTFVPNSTNFNPITVPQSAGNADIAKAELGDMNPALAAIDNLVFDNTDQVLITAGAIANGKVMYKVGDGAWTENVNDITGKNAGIYNVSYYYKSTSSNYKDSGSETSPVGSLTGDAAASIAKADFDTYIETSPTAFSPAKTYTGSNVRLLSKGFEAKMGGVTIPCDKSYTVVETSANFTAYADVVAVNAGVYAVNYKVTAKAGTWAENNFNDYEGTVADAEIAKAPLDIVAQDVEVDWTGTAIDLAASRYAKGDPTDFVAGETEEEQYAIVATLVQLKWIVEDGNTTIPTDAGYYKFKLDYATPDPTPCNYVINDFKPTAALQINKIDPTPATVAKATLTYNGDDQALLEVTGTVAGGETLYFVGDDAPAIPASLDNIGTEWSKDIPEETDADTYKVWYMTKGDKNHNDIAPASVEVTIAQKALDIAMFDFDLDELKAMYTGDDMLPTLTFVAFDGAPSDPENKNALADADYTVEYYDSNGDPVTEMVDVDVYSIVFVATTDGNYKDNAYTTFEITPAPATCEAPEANELTYNGEDQALVVEPTYNGGTLEYSLDGTTWSEDIPEGKDADTYEVYYRVVADGNHTDFTCTDPVEVEIAPKALADEMFALSPDDLEYTGADQKASVTVTATDLNGENNIITDADFVETKVEYDGDEVTELVNAGEYTYTFTGQGNYTGTAEATISIAQIEADIVEPTEIHLTYNNTDQALVTEGSTDAVEGKVEYQVSFEGEVIVPWTEEYAEVVGKNAGAYTVEYKITASDVNYTNPLVAGSIDVTILKAEINYVLGNVTKDWDGETFDNDQINSLFTLHTGELFGEDKYDRPFDFVVPQDFKDAGEYSFTVSQKDVVFKEGYPVNYDVKVTGEAKLVINKVDIVAADYVAPKAATGLVYKNGTAQNLIADGYKVNTEYQFDGAEKATPIGTIVFATEKDGEYSETVPQGTDADDYEIWWKVVGDKNHNDTEAQKIENSIAANGTGFQLAFEDATWTYDGVEFYPADVNAYDGKTATEPGIATDPETDYDFALTKDGEEFSGKLKDAGTYVFTYTGKGNYEGSSAQATLVITPKNIADADVTVALSKETVEFNNENQKPTYTLTYAPAEKPALTLAEGEDKDFTVAADEEMVAGGEYTFTFTGKGNYTGTKTAKFNITKRVVIAQAEDVEKVYNSLYGLELPGGKEVEVPITWGNLIKGDTNVPTLGEGAITVEPYKNEVGKYTIIVDGSKFVSDNYEVKKGQREAFLTITPAPLTVKWDNQPASKVYGTADPDLKGHIVLVGAQGGDGEGLTFNTQITRTAGENVGKYDVALAAGTSNAAKKIFANYDVTFEGAEKAFEITKAELTVSLTPQKVAYTGKKAVLDELTAEDLLVNGLIVNPALGINDYKDVVTTMPEIIVPDDAINVGSYELDFKAGTGDAANYKFNFLHATLDIVPFDISKATVTIPEQQVKVGQVAADVIDAEGFTIELDGFTEDNAAEFQVVAADRFIDGDGKIKTGANPEKGLVLVPVDATAKKNYTGWENDAFTGNLIVVGAATLILDDSKDIATTAQNGVDVTFSSRNILQDTWNVVCLPFDATIKEISEAFGYAAVDLLKRDSSDGSMHFIITSSGTVPAGEPFIVKPTSDEELNAKSNFNQITFYGVNVKAYTDNPTPVADEAGNKFCGTFKAQTTISGEKFWYMSKGMWKHSVSKPVNIAAYRAYLEVASADTRIFIEEPDGSITAIDAINFNNNEIDAEGWYTVNGMKLDAAPTQKGTYIKDGKKVFVK